MKLLFNKKTLDARWFRVWECKPADDTTGYTEKIPPHTLVEWNEELNEWVELPEPEEDEGEPEASEGIHSEM